MVVKVGEKFFEGMIDITDPCYDKDTWCRMGKEIAKGVYNCNITMSDEGIWGKRVKAIEIFQKGLKKKNTHKKYIGFIGVDAGLAGFFMNKPDYDDIEWAKFCDKIREGDYWFNDEGFFSSSGYGDGEYPVYCYKAENNPEDIVGLKIVFIR